jgi:hypothetical protein
MSEETIKILLSTGTEEDFFETLTDETGLLLKEQLSGKVIENVDLWDKKVVEHCLKLTGISYEKLKKEMYIDELEYYD